MLFYIWEDARIWAHWNHSFHVHLSYPIRASILCVFTPWAPLGLTTGSSCNLMAAWSQAFSFLSAFRAQGLTLEGWNRHDYDILALLIWQEKFYFIYICVCVYMCVCVYIYIYIYKLLIEKNFKLTEGQILLLETIGKVWSFQVQPVLCLYAISRGVNCIGRGQKVTVGWEHTGDVLGLPAMPSAGKQKPPDKF